jgi:hypothetical protein
MTGAGVFDELFAKGEAGAALGGLLGPVGAGAGAAAGVVATLADATGLTRWLFGPNAAALQGQVKTALAVATGTSDELAQAAVLARNPDASDALRIALAQIAAQAQAEADTASQAKLSSVLADVAGARARDLAVRGVDGGRNVRADIMLGAVTLGLLACIISAATGHLDQMTFGLVAGIAGMLSGCFKDAFGFEFGSSRQSEAKTAIIADLASQATTTAKAATPAA